MSDHTYHEEERCPRSINLARHIRQSNGDIGAALNAMQPAERAGAPMQHLNLKELNFRRASQMLAQSGHAEWAEALNAYADGMYKGKYQGR